MERIKQGIAQLGECRTRTAEAAGAGPATLTNKVMRTIETFDGPALNRGAGWYMGSITDPSD